jgi:hypothetical protein
MAKKNQTVEKICLLFVVLAKEPCLANEQVVAASEQAVMTQNQAMEKIFHLPIT